MAKLTPKPKVAALARALGVAVTATGLILLPSDGCTTSGVAIFEDAGPDISADAGAIDASLDAAPEEDLPDSGEFVGI